MPGPHKEDALRISATRRKPRCRYISGMTFEQLKLNDVLQDALIRRLEIIGEATKRFSQAAPELRAAHPEIPWQAMAGMRDVLIHAYDNVDLEEVWRAVTVIIPSILPHLRALQQMIRQ